MLKYFMFALSHVINSINKHLEIKYTTSIGSRSGIQSIQNEFKLIKFDNNKRRQVGRLVVKKNTMAHMVDIVNILIDHNSNCLLFKNNVEYTWAKFIQASKMSKSSIDMFFNNLDLALMQQYLSYKNVNKMRIL